jgi:hypothetical protein
VSILAHAGLVFLTVFVVWSVQGPDDAEKTVVPSTTLGETPSAQLEAMDQQSQLEQSSDSQAEQSQSSSPLQSEVKSTASLIGSAGQSGSASPFGSTPTQASGSDAKFMGQKVGGNVTKLVFLIDTSGSLIDTLPFVIDQLKTTIRELSGKQQFAVLFFPGKKSAPTPFVEAPPTGLKKAIPSMKNQVIDWIKLGQTVVAGGTAQPVAAIERALTYKPELLVILSDDITGTGVTQIDQQKLLDEIQRVNTANTKINTIQFLYPDPLAKYDGMKGTMQRIAEQTGGKYKFVDEAEVRQ